ncbi:MAG TPA: PTS transporter subunit EIIC [Candidatus Elarobacter sp.]|jgi:PTS system cellobiose-specific IIC component|nr:PTS transporter subunit EIIC [Candidatus Elarobacter sp.]
MSRSSAASKPSSASSEDGTPQLSAPAGDGFVARLERAAAPYAHRIAEAPAVQALQESLPVAFAVALLVLVARLAAALLSRPFPGLGVLKDVLPSLMSGFAVASVVTAVVLALRLARRLECSRAALAGASLAAFALSVPRETVAALTAFARGGGDGARLEAATRTLGTSGIFTAIVVTLAVAGAVALARRRFGARLGTAAGAVAAVGVAAALFALGLSPASGLATVLAPLATLGDSFAALAVLVAVESLLWLVGLHGPALLAALVLPVYLTLQAQNTAAVALHHPAPHIVVVSTFLFVFPGGAGATLPLVALLARSRVRRLRAIGLATVLPGLFNVNEPVMFGLPVVYNPVLAVPFVLAPLALACTTYAAMALGLVGKPLFYVPSMLPPLVNVFLATLDWRACVLVAVNLAIAGAIWLPFVRVYERAEALRAETARAA